MAFKREVLLDIGINNSLGIRVSSLHFNFEIERSVKAETNYGKFTIYNAKKETREKTLVKDNNIVLKAGYKDEDNLSLIFFGLIQESSTKFQNIEYVTELYATDFGNNQSNIKKQTVNFSFNSGVSYSSIISDLASIMGVPIIGQELLSSIILNNGFVFHGTIIQLVRQLQKKLLAYDIGFYFDLGEMIIYSLSITPSQFGIVNLSPQSGLIGEVEEILDDEDEGTKRIKFVSLINPKIKPNTVMRIKSEKFTGGVIVEKVMHKGGNIGIEEFITEGEALIG